MPVTQIVRENLDLPETLRVLKGLGVGATPDASPVLRLGNGTGAAVSAAGTLAIRYNAGAAEMSVNGGGWAPFGGPVGAQYWVAAADPTLTNEYNLGVLATGLVKNTAGVPSIAVAGTDYQAPITIAAGQVAYATATNTLGGSAAHVWDNTFGRLGVNMATPAASLHVGGESRFENGNGAGVFTLNQLTLAFGGGNYRHAIKTRHVGGGPQGNAIDFYLWDQTTDATTTTGTKRVASFDNGAVQLFNGSAGIAAAGMGGLRYHEGTNKLQWAQNSSTWVNFDAFATGGITLAAGQIAYGTATNAIGGTSNLVWDNSNVRLGVAMSSPLYAVDIAGQSNATQVRFGNSTANNGGFLTSSNAQQAFLSGGFSFNGTNWVARSTAASIVGMDAGSVFIYGNTGLTTGSTAIGPIELAQFHVTSGFVVRGGQTAAGTGSGVWLGYNGDVANTGKLVAITQGTAYRDMSYEALSHTFRTGTTGTVTYATITTSGAFLLSSGSAATAAAAYGGFKYHEGTNKLMWSQNNSTWVNLDAFATGGAITVGAGQVAYGSGSNALTSEAAFFYDATNNRLGVGQGTPLYAVDIAGGNASQIHFGNGTADSGGYLVSTAAADAYLMAGAAWNAAWTAKSTTAAIFGQVNGAFTWYGNTGLTPGSGFTPTALATLSTAGAFQLNNGTSTTVLAPSSGQVTHTYNGEAQPRYNIARDALGSGLAGFTAGPGTTNTIAATGVGVGFTANSTLGFYVSNGSALAAGAQLAYSSSTYHLQLTQTNSRITIAASANIGSPSTLACHRLTLYTDATTIQNYSLGIESGFMWLNANGGFKFYASGSEVARLKSTGYLAVGGSYDPLYPLVAYANADLCAINFRCQFNGSDDGGYLGSFGADSAYLGGGMRYQSAVGWKARATNCGGLEIINGVTNFYANFSQTVGNTFTPTVRAQIGDNISLGGTGSFGGGVGVVFIKDRTTAPTSDPSGGGILFSEGGALMWRNPSGAVTEVAP